MKEINLEEIYLKIIETTTFRPLVTHCDPKHNTPIYEAMKEACKQTLELAAENANIELKEVGEELVITDIFEYDNIKININKQSILNTINQIK